MALLGVLGEDDSDTESLAVMIRRIREVAQFPRVKILQKGYDGWSGLIKKGAKQLVAWEKVGCTRAYICFDADRDPNHPPEVRMDKLTSLIKSSGVKIPCCPIVPVQELEAWFHGDIEALGELFHWCKGNVKQVNSPELINDPKESLQRISRKPSTHKIHYIPALHNPVLAKFVRLELVEQCCPSFVPFAKFTREELVGDEPGDG